MSIDLLQEAQQELRQERLNSFFKKYFKYLIAFILFSLITGALGAWWTQHNKNNIHKEAAEYIKTLQMLNNVGDKGALNSVLESFENLAKGSSVYATLAKINLANISDALGKYNKSIYYYGIVANDPNADGGLRSFSNLMKASSSIRSGKNSAKEILEMLKNGNKIDEKSFSTSKNLIKASLLLEEGEKEEARKVLKSIKSSDLEGQYRGIIELLISLTY